MSFGEGDLHVRLDKLEAANAKLCDEINRLTAENDELREEYDWLYEFHTRMASHCGTKDVPNLVAYMNKLERENAELRMEGSKAFYNEAYTVDENRKLRDLVKHLRECTKHNTCAACCYVDDVCDFEYDMRELGIEVER